MTLECFVIGRTATGAPPVAAAGSRGVTAGHVPPPLPVVPVAPGGHGICLVGDATPVFVVHAVYRHQSRQACVMRGVTLGAGEIVLDGGVGRFPSLHRLMNP